MFSICNPCHYLTPSLSGGAFLQFSIKLGNIIVSLSILALKISFFSKGFLQISRKSRLFFGKQSTARNLITRLRIYMHLKIPKYACTYALKTIEICTKNPKYALIYAKYAVIIFHIYASKLTFYWERKRREKE